MVLLRSHFHSRKFKWIGRQINGRQIQFIWENWMIDSLAGAKRILK
jgi:hypothetical protein